MAERSSLASSGPSQRASIGHKVPGSVIRAGSSPGISMISQRRRAPPTLTTVIGRLGSQSWMV